MSVQAAISSHFSTPDIVKSYAKTESVTGPIASALIAQAASYPAPSGPQIVLDNACGMGVVTAMLFASNAPKDTKVVCGDISQPMIDAAQKRIAAAGWNAEAKVVDAQALDFTDNYFTQVLTHFGVQAFPDGRSSIAESLRVTIPGGIIGFTTFPSLGWYPLLRVALSRIPGAPQSIPDIPNFLRRGGDWHDAAFFRSELEKQPQVIKASIKVESMDLTTPMDDPEGFLLASKGPLGVVMMEWTEEERNACKDKLDRILLQLCKETKEVQWTALIATAQKIA